LVSCVNRWQWQAAGLLASHLVVQGTSANGDAVAATVPAILAGGKWRHSASTSNGAQACKHGAKHVIFFAYALACFSSAFSHAKTTKSAQEHLSCQSEMPDANLIASRDKTARALGLWWSRWWWTACSNFRWQHQLTCDPNHLTGKFPSAHAADLLHVGYVTIDDGLATSRVGLAHGLSRLGKHIRDILAHGTRPVGRA